MSRTLRPPARLLGGGDAVLALDIGGTQIKSAAVDADGRIDAVRRTPTPLGPDAVVAAIADLARAHGRRDEWELRPTSIGVCVPGLVDESRGVVRYASNLGWRDVPLRRMLEQELGLPVAVQHDVRAAALAESRIGAAYGYPSALVVAIGTGICGALVIDGTPYSGGGYAGEIGHAVADPQGERCPCGAVGCLETIASASAIARRYTAASGVAVGGAREVFDAAQRGDRHAAAVWADAVTALAEGVARLVAAFAPHAVVVGGGLAQAGEALVGPLRAELDRMLSFHRRPFVLSARCGEDAGVVGAAITARDLASALRAGAGARA
ncbi:ROK family protein [Microbacterium sp. ZW T2_14]|uniref:ROK family protein n=1 Tax=Microbacterium sp. ZW T2_14 TaxID=3378079 RepID=UPI0038519C19